MWNWWERTIPTRLAGVPGMIGEPALIDSTMNVVTNDVTDSQCILSSKLPLSQQCPRTLKDLTDMIAAAKAAQWSEQESDMSSEELLGTGDNFFDDDSSTSSNSIVDDSSQQQQPQQQNKIEVVDGEELKSTNQVFESHFSDHQQSQTVSSPSSPNPLSRVSSKINTNTNVKGAITAIGPTSDTLTPIVKVSHQYERLALNNQSIQLAKGWKLGFPFVDSWVPNSVGVEKNMHEIDDRIFGKSTQIHRNEFRTENSFPVKGGMTINVICCLQNFLPFSLILLLTQLFLVINPYCHHLIGQKIPKQ